MSGNAAESNVTNILLTGRPGVGKTTVIVRLLEGLARLDVAGFCTEEIREAGQRRGFRAATYSGESCVLAHVDVASRSRIGRYGVDVAAFERLVLPELARRANVTVIDEIGKMECFSPRFIDAVRKLLDDSAPVVATVALRGGGFMDEVKSRPDVVMCQITPANRNELPKRLVERVAGMCGH